MYFFFQAEDGIRDTSVTGVQTCALPIFERTPDGIDRIEERFLVLLQIAIVAAGQAFQYGEQTDEISNEAAAFPARQLSHIRIFFLRHQAGTGGEGVAEFDETKFARTPDDQVFAESGKMNANHGQAVKKIADKIAIAHRIDAVLGDALEAEHFCDSFPVECNG